MAEIRHFWSDLVLFFLLSSNNNSETCSAGLSCSVMISICRGELEVDFRVQCENGKYVYNGDKETGLDV